VRAETPVPPVLGKAELAGPSPQEGAAPSCFLGGELVTEVQAIRKELLALATNGRIRCADALELARKLGVCPRRVGREADRLGIKITSCQLGCF